MPDARITIEGRIASDPRYSATQSGIQVANLRILAGRSKKGDDGQWETLSTTAYDVAFWRQHHDLVASLNPGKGDSVTVTGTITGLESYQGNNGESLSVKVAGDGIRHFPKQDRPQQGYQQQGQPSAPQGGDPWAGGGQGGYDPDQVPF